MIRKNSRITRFYALLIALAVIVAMIATSVIAYYLRNSGEVKNTFKPAVSVVPEIKETFDNVVKKDVYFEVGNTDYPVYVRAAIVITWQSEDGTVYFSKPIEDTDYTIDLNMTDWELGKDGFYYFKNSVASGGKTSVLINTCEQIEEAPVEGYTLSVEILVQTVQAVGYTDGDGENPTTEIPAYKDAWGLS